MIIGAIIGLFIILVIHAAILMALSARINRYNKLFDDEMAKHVGKAKMNINYPIAAIQLVIFALGGAIIGYFVS